jgi:hypothetical protein
MVDGERRNWKESVVGVASGVGGRLKIVLAWIGSTKGDILVGGDSAGGEGCRRVLFLRGERPGRHGASVGADVGGRCDGMDVGDETWKGKAFEFTSANVGSGSGAEG